MDSTSVRFVSDCFVLPRQVVEESKKPIHLTPWDLRMISRHYIQKGLLFVKPQEAYTQKDFMRSFLEKLKYSLSLALVHFYPLTGQLKTVRSDEPHVYTICIDCVDSPGVRFIYATLDMTVSGILSPDYVPQVVQSFFDHDRAVNHDGHTRPLVSIQVTELVDGVFIGCSCNHAVGDGTTYWNFFNSWSEIFLAIEQGSRCDSISCPPVLSRWFPEGCDIPINLPFHDPSEFISPYETPALKERIFSFSGEVMARMKAKVNEECGTRGKGDEISSFKALAALVWRSIIRARCLLDDQVTSCTMSANNRPRMCKPGLPPYYFGNCVSPVETGTTVSELLGAGGLVLAAQLLHVAVAELTAEKINDSYRNWVHNPAIYSLGQSVDPYSILVSSSPRFNMYGPEFGLGKAVAARSGYANKFDGKVTAYPGREGGGSVALEICLLPETMAALEADAEFMAAVMV